MESEMSRSFINLQRLQEGPWPAFERLLARYLEHGGFADVTIVGGSGDLGADIVGQIHGRRWVIQAKYRSGTAVGKSAIEEAYKAHWEYEADVFVTSTNQYFSPDATTYWKSLVGRGFDARLWDQNWLLEQAERLPEHSAFRRVPRGYQREAVDAIHHSLESGARSGLVTLATGLGKTMVASTFVAEFLEKNPQARVLVVAHVVDLVRQLERSFWPQLSKFTNTHLWTDGEKPIGTDGVTFATWQAVSIAMKDGEPLNSAFDLVFVDECHHAPSESFSRLLSALDAKYVLGVTATPWRGDGESLRPLFGDPLFSMDVVAGMQQGYLAHVDYLMLLDDIDWDEIRRLSREGLTVKDLNQRLYVPERDVGMIQAIFEAMQDMRNPRVLVFCRSIDHAERLQRFFRQYDIAAGMMHSELHRSERFTALTRFRMGEIKVLISIEMLNEGIDVPEVNMVVFARVTHSRRIFLQQLGRGLRLSEHKSHVKVLDFVADVRRLAAGLEINSEARRFKNHEEVRYPDGDIVHFTRYSEDFFMEYLEDMANISDLDDSAHLAFPI
jgi:superfamily II DNA or RNA helicase